MATDTKIEWAEYKNGKVHVAYNPDTERVLCVVGYAEGAPCDMYALQLMDHMYLSMDAAKKDAEEHARHFFTEDIKPPVPFKDRMLGFLRAVTKAVESGALDPAEVAGMVEEETATGMGKTAESPE